jgi:8-oxo-dGTP diphosphatase
MRGIALRAHLELEGKVTVTVDSVIIAESESGPQVLLIKRGKQPFEGFWAFPGGRLDGKKDKDILSGAYRELKEETKLEDVVLEFFKTVGNSTRDPRGFTVTNIYVGRLPCIPQGIKAGDDAVNYEFYGVNNLPDDMAFDHREIIGEIIKKYNIN